MESTGIDVASGKRAYWVGAVGAAACCAARARRASVLATLGGGKAFGQAVLSRQLGNCGRWHWRLRIFRLRTPALFKVRRHPLMRCLLEHTSNSLSELTLNFNLIFFFNLKVFIKE